MKIFIIISKSFACFAQNFAPFAVKNKLILFIKIFVFVNGLLIPSLVFSQNENITELISNIAEEMAADETDAEAISLLVEQLQELSMNPVKINSSDESEISRLFFLSDFQIKSIADYVKSSGNILSVYEITGIPGFDRQTAERMIPFISYSAGIYDNNDSIIRRNTLLTNLLIKPGERDTASQGSQLRLLTKYRFTAGRFAAGFTAEKDPGEKILTGSPPLPDFLSAYLSYTGKGIIRELIAGDYSARFGQGININTGIRTNLSLTASGYMPGRDEIRPYTSTDENNLFRGVAAEFSLKKLSLSMFCSQNKIDATLGISADSMDYFVENLYISGLHNTQSLISKKDALVLTAYGVNLVYNLKSLRLGALWAENRFNLPFRKDSGKPEELYEFEGKKNQIYSVYYNSQIRRILLSGELSFNDDINFAIVQGVYLRPSDRLTVNFLYRYYSPGFTTFTGKGPGSGTTTNNENGILGNFTFEAAKHLFISAGCDISNFPWLKYRCSFPSMAKREEIKLKYLPSENLTFDLSFYMRSSMLDDQNENGIAAIERTRNRTFKGLIKYSPDENLTFTSRVDYKIADPSGSKGVLLSQDIIYQFGQIPVTVWFRYCIFNTEDWDSRLYIYENDLLQSFSIPALSGKGERSYLMVKWDISDTAELRIKYGITSLTGDGVIRENKDELKLQFRIRF